MKTILIAGAGQLGSRHLQGVKTSNLDLDIWVFDISEESLKVAEERYNQVESKTNKTVHYIKSLREVPFYIDVVIVASSSKSRYDIVNQLLAFHKVSYIVLEKFLFPRLSDYDDVATLFKEKKVKAFVNCPRRMWESYYLIAKNLDYTKPIEMSFKGKDWGLCCNSIHFIDIFMMLSKSNYYSINIDDVIPEVINSKREGYVELMGVERITTPNGSSLTLSCTIDYKEAPKLIIINGDILILVNEATGEININGEIYKTTVKYQSELSGLFVDCLINNGTCNLTSYSDSSNFHKIYLSVIAPFINKIKGWESNSCPIT